MFLCYNKTSQSAAGDSNDNLHDLLIFNKGRQLGRLYYSVVVGGQMLKFARTLYLQETKLRNDAYP